MAGATPAAAWACAVILPGSPCGEVLGEAAQAPKRPRLDGSKWNVQVRGDLWLGEAAEVGQHQNLALLVGEAVERVTNLTAASIALGQLAAVLTGNIAQVVQRDGDVGTAAQVIDCPLGGRTDTPPGQASGWVVATVVLPDLVEDSLKDVVGVVVANKALHVAAHGRAQGDIDLPDCLLPVVNELGSETAHALVHCESHRWPPSGRPRGARMRRRSSATCCRRSSSARPPHTPYRWRGARAESAPGGGRGQTPRTAL